MSEAKKQDEKELKQRLMAQAEKLGFSIHPNTSVKKMLEQVNKLLKYELEGAPDAPMEVAKGKNQSEARKEALRKVPVRIIPLDPRIDQEYQMFSTGNDVIGTIRQVVPLESEKPFHVPQAIIPHIQEIKHRVTRYKPDVKTGEEIPYSVEVPSYRVEIHPALTAEELESIKQRQLAEKRIS